MSEDYRHPKYKHELELVEYEQFHELEKRVEALEKASASPNLKSGDFSISPFSTKGSREQSAEEFTNSGKLASANADVEVSQLQNFGSRRRRKVQK